MNKTLIAAIIVGMLLIFKSSKRMPTDEEYKKYFTAIAQKYGVPFAQQIEKLFRLETAHFSSKQYQKSFSPGMEAHSEKYPYGWGTLSPYWQRNPNYKPTGLISENENPGATGTGKGLKKFVAFPSFEAALNSVAYLLYGRGDITTWYSRNTANQKIYSDTLKGIKTHYV